MHEVDMNGELEMQFKQTLSQVFKQDLKFGINVAKLNNVSVVAYIGLSHYCDWTWS